MLTDKQLRAISSFNGSEGLLESVIKQLRDTYYQSWLDTKPEHFKQREELYTKTTVLDDVATLIRTTTNKSLFD
ncbi:MULTISPECIES: hypothetical protein [Enterobacter cloacae complex]|uniref:hypothetical protein n=1 Tax=Enterobacter cloacae complex TaxID=354276 RepID=UPI0013D320FA|nr:MULTISPECIES: hypothetical protein [Enterobacter cloacae complex]MBG0579350.1 hypothetical protein [Enterobacter kobei]